MEITVIFEKKDEYGRPYTYTKGNEVYMENSSIPFTPNKHFAPLYLALDLIMGMSKTVELHIKLDYFSTAMRNVFHDIFKKFSDKAHKCKPFIKWYYFEDDEETLIYGENFSEFYPKVTFEFLPQKPPPKIKK